MQYEKDVWLSCCSCPQDGNAQSEPCKVEWSRSSGSCVTYCSDVWLYGHLVGLHPHIYSSPLETHEARQAQMRTSWLLTIKITSGQWAAKKRGESGKKGLWIGRWMKMKKRRHREQVGEQLRWKCDGRIQANDRRKKKGARNKAQRDAEREKEMVRFGPNGNYTAPAVTIKQQVDAIIRPGR